MRIGIRGVVPVGSSSACGLGLKRQRRVAAHQILDPTRQRPVFEAGVQATEIPDVIVADRALAEAARRDWRCVVTAQLEVFGKRRSPWPAPPIERDVMTPARHEPGEVS